MSDKALMKERALPATPRFSLRAGLLLFRCGTGWLLYNVVWSLERPPFPISRLTPIGPKTSPPERLFNRGSQISFKIDRHDLAEYGVKMPLSIDKL